MSNPRRLTPFAHLAVILLMGAIAPTARAQGLSASFKGSDVAEPGQPPAMRLVLKNFSDKPATATLEYSVQSDSTLFSGPAADLGAVGTIVFKANKDVDVAAKASVEVALGDGKTPLKTGAYLVVAKITIEGRTDLIYRNLFVMPAPIEKVSRTSRFGLNASEPKMIAINRRLGVGWIRFENFKWPMCSPEAGVYRFDGTVGPWHVNHDAIIGDYAAQGITALPFLFQSALYGSTAPADLKGGEGRRMAYPPADNNAFAEFCFQSAARYGSTKHAADDLKTPDKVSAKGQVPVYEIWNEPNLTDPAWGPWVGTAAQYLELFRVAAEAVKRADPSAQVTNGGYAGLTVNTIDELRTYKYADGKRPLDFVDILNVHYYSGRVAPELATIDTNVERKTGGGGGQADAPTYEEHLKRLIAWRDTNKPGMPIWLTETGYDTGGNFGIGERLQAARLPRVVLAALASGIDKVFVYREKGSTPSHHAAAGLVREDGTLKPSYFTYCTLIRSLDGLTRCDRIAHPDPKVRVYLWRNAAGDEGAVLTAWAVDEGTAALGLDLGKCAVTDAFGAKRDAELKKETPLSIFPMYVSGIADVSKLSLIGK